MRRLVWGFRSGGKWSGTHSIGEGVPGEDGPSLPVGVVLEALVDVLPEPIDIV